MIDLTFETILMLLMLGGAMPPDQDPLPPEQAFQYLPEECLMVGFVDLRDIDQTFESLLDTARSQEWITTNEALSELLIEATTAIEESRATATTTLGFNPFSELTSASGCFRLGSSPLGLPIPQGLLVVRGNFDDTLAQNIAGMIGLVPTELDGGGSFYGETDDGITSGLAFLEEGVILLGTRDMIAPVFADRGAYGTLPSYAADSLNYRVFELIPEGAYAFLGFQPSGFLRVLVATEAPATVRELIAGLSRAIVVTTRDRTTFLEVHANNQESYRDYELILTAVQEYILAFHHTFRAIIMGGAGFLSANDEELEEPLRVLLNHREDVLSWMEEVIWTEGPYTELSTDPTTFTVTLTMGETEVLEAAAVIGILTGYLFMLGRYDEVAVESGYDPYYDPYY